MKSVIIKGKRYKLPIFLPDATRGVVKALDSRDLESVGIKGVMVNTYHLITSPGLDVIKKAGGIKKFMNFNGLVSSDSGGWQLYSLIHRNSNKGKITNEGISFTVGGGKKEIITPEEIVRSQFDIGSDIITILDDFTPPDANRKRVRESVDRTTLWAQRSKKEFEKICKKRKLTKKNQPKIMAVIQGGWDKKERAKSAEELLEIGFDGFGLGGYIVDKRGKLDYDLAGYIARLIPDGYFRFALGLGRPMDVVKCFYLGWQIFDCTLPTRDGRNERMYVFSKNPKSKKDLLREKTHQFFYIGRGKYANDKKPISSNCDCPICKNYTRGYLQHLFRIKDISAMRLGSLHNLRTYARITEMLGR